MLGDSGSWIGKCVECDGNQAGAVSTERQGKVELSDKGDNQRFKSRWIYTSLA